MKPSDRLLARARECHRNGDLAGAEKGYAKVLKKDPRNIEALSFMGLAHLQARRADAAISAFNKILALKPKAIITLNNMGLAHRLKGDPERAAGCFERAAALDPDYAEARINLGIARMDQGRLADAASCFEMLLRQRGPDPRVLFNLGTVRLDQGKFNDAESLFRAIVERDPAHHDARSNLLFGMCYNPDHTPEEVFHAHRAWGDRYAALIRDQAFRSHLNDRDPERVIRIGYVSPDFNAHAVYHFIKPLLAHHDPQQVSVTCYANVAEPDACTAELKRLVPRWRDIHPLPDRAVAEQIRRDGIDILVDLAGHTRDNRLSVFAHHPAPVQAAYLGYCATTGLSAIDYRLTDIWADPAGTEKYYTEHLLRLPGGLCCYAPFPNAPAVAPPPCLANGYMTYGCFLTLRKVNPRVIALWAKVLGRQPDARMLLFRYELSSPGRRERIHAEFERHGIDRERVELIWKKPERDEHLALYHRVDAMLDTFPFNGHTSTLEALLMGVPVITLAGRTFAGRLGVSMLTVLDMTDFIAESEDGFVHIADRLAADPERLARLRGGLRDTLLRNPICDGARFTRTVEEAYREMWVSWCSRTR